MKVSAWVVVLRRNVRAVASAAVFVATICVIMYMAAGGYESRYHQISTRDVHSDTRPTSRHASVSESSREPIHAEMVWHELYNRNMHRFDARVAVRLGHGYTLKCDSHRTCNAEARYTFADGREQDVPVSALIMQNDPGPECVCSIRSRDAVPGHVQSIRIHASASAIVYDPNSVVRGRISVRRERGHEFALGGRRLVTDSIFEDDSGDETRYFADFASVDGNLDGLASIAVVEPLDSASDEYSDVVVYNDQDRAVVSVPFGGSDGSVVVLEYDMMRAIDVVQLESERVFELSP